MGITFGYAFNIFKRVVPMVPLERFVFVASLFHEPLVEQHNKIRLKLKNPKLETGKENIGQN